MIVIRGWSVLLYFLGDKFSKLAYEYLGFSSLPFAEFLASTKLKLVLLLFISSLTHNQLSLDFIYYSDQMCLLFDYFQIVCSLFSLFRINQSSKLPLNLEFSL